MSVTTISRTKIGHEKLVTTKNIEWWEAIAIIVCVEGFLFLIAMYFVVRCVVVERDLFRRIVEAIHKRIDKDLMQFEDCC